MLVVNYTVVDRVIVEKSCSFQCEIEVDTKEALFAFVSLLFNKG